MVDAANVLVTGNMGYVGPMVVARLRGLPAVGALIGADAGFFAHCVTTTRGLPERLLDEQLFVDVRRFPPERLRGIDAVVHLAAISNDPLGKEFEAVTDEINHRVTVQLARAARDAGVGRFVFASSCSVYGSADGSARTEASPARPLSAYARSKIDAEKGLEALATERFAITCLRFPTACGMSPRLRLDLVLNDFVASAVASRVIRILSDGTPWRPLIDVQDMARAIEWAIQREPTAGGAFLTVNVGRNEWNYQVREIADAVREQMPHVSVEIAPGARGDPRSYRVDFSRYAQLAPEHLPEVPLDRSIWDLRLGLDAIGFSDSHFRESALVRLEVLRRFRERQVVDSRLEWTS